MVIELKIPEVGESITEVQISEWLKFEGDTVKKDEALAVIDSEKTTFELPSPENGKLTKIIHQAGDTVDQHQKKAEQQQVTDGVHWKTCGRNKSRSSPTISLTSRGNAPRIRACL